MKDNNENKNENVNGKPDKAKSKKKIKRIIIFSIIAVLAWGFCFLQNNLLDITEYTYVSDKVTDESDGFRIVHISDFHDKNFADRMADRISALNPDIIVITGDIVDGLRTDIDKSARFLKYMSDIAPTYYAVGNHEYIIDDDEREELFEKIESSGGIILKDRTITLCDNLTLTGVDGYKLMNLIDFSDVLPTDTESLNILLAHEPQLIEQYSSAGSVDLVLTGHAHGGQFIFPFVGGLYAPDQGVLPEYTQGMHTMNDTTMIISRGVGNSGFPFRLFNYPEIICIDLEKP